MRPQRKIMMVEATYAFVKLKQIKAAVSAGGIKFPTNAHPSINRITQELVLVQLVGVTAGCLLKSIATPCLAARKTSPEIRSEDLLCTTCKLGMSIATASSMPVIILLAQLIVKASA